MKSTICDGTVERFEHSHSDLVDEIRLMAVMAETGAATAQAAPTREARRPWLFARLLARAAAPRRAA